ncbi:MAG TPA: AI-2E family transporter [Thermoanaerobaculia bacterium]|nr:AI-2E family transporter [Thermoanaerobaculia bacterium]
MRAQQEASQARIFGSVIVVAVIGYVCWRVLLPFLGGIAWAVVFAAAAWTPWQRLERRMVRRRGLAAALLVMALGLLVLLPAAFFVGMVVNEANAVASHGLALLKAKQVSSFSDLVALPRVAHLLDGLKAQAGISQDEFQKVAESLATTASSVVAGLSAKLLFGAFDAIVTFAIALFMLFFLFRDGVQIATAALELLPMDDEARSGLSNSLRNMLVAIFRGSLLCALVQGVIGGVGWWMAGLGSPALAGAAMAIFSLLPIGGTAIVWLPGGIWAWTQGHHGAAIFLLLWGLLAVSVFSDTVLRPRLVRGSEELSTLVVFFGVFGGLPAFGLLGIFIGPIALALALTLLGAMRRRINPATGPAPSDTGVVDTGIAVAR